MKSSYSACWLVLRSHSKTAVHYHISCSNMGHDLRNFQCHMSPIVRKPALRIGEKKTQIRFAVTAKLISAFVFATRIVHSLYCLNPKFQAPSHLLWLYTDLVGNPEDWFSHNEAQGSKVPPHSVPAYKLERCCIAGLRVSFISMSDRSPTKV